MAAREAAHGVIVLAGVPLVAKPPPELHTGQTLHLRVTEVTAGGRRRGVRLTSAG